VTAAGAAAVGKLDGRVAVVTGGARGIGAAYARGLAAEGAAVAVCDVLDPSATVAAVAAAGGRALGMIADVSDRAAVAGLVARTLEAYGRIDALINNAAVLVLRPTPFTEIDPAEWERVMRVNVRGTMECARAVVPAMRAAGYGKIVNVASDTFLRGTPWMLHYVASKGAVIAMTRAMAQELGADGIRVNCIAPGLTMSEAILAVPDGPVKNAAGAVAIRALKRDELPEDLVGAAVFLASADSDFMTGQTLVVNGGASVV